MKGAIEQAPTVSDKLQPDLKVKPGVQEDQQ